MSRKPKGGVEKDAPTYVDGKRERAPARGVKDSDIPDQSLGETQGGVAKDTLEIINGKCERAPARG